MKNTSARLITTTLSALLVLAGSTLAGCTKDSSGALDSTASTNSSGTNSANVGSQGAAGEGLSAAPELAGVKVQPGTATDKFEGARADISDLSCTSDGNGVWNVEGNVKNATGKAVNYRIYTSFLSGTETLGLIETDIDNVKSNSTKKWTGSMKIDAEKIDCVLRVERVAR